jgi:ribonuclease HI
MSRVASAGGGVVILSPKGNTRINFAWGLGLTTNNHMEALAFYQGIKIATQWE